MHDSTKYYDSRKMCLIVAEQDRFEQGNGVFLKKLFRKVAYVGAKPSQRHLGQIYETLFTSLRLKIVISNSSGSVVKDAT